MVASTVQGSLGEGFSFGGFFEEPCHTHPCEGAENGDGGQEEPEFDPAPGADRVHGKYEGHGEDRHSPEEDGFPAPAPCCEQEADRDEEPQPGRPLQKTGGVPDGREAEAFQESRGAVRDPFLREVLDKAQGAPGRLGALDFKPGFRDEFPVGPESRVNMMGVEETSVSDFLVDEIRGDHEKRDQQGP